MPYFILLLLFSFFSFIKKNEYSCKLGNIPKCTCVSFGDSVQPTHQHIVNRGSKAHQPFKVWFFHRSKTLFEFYNILIIMRGNLKGANSCFLVFELSSKTRVHAIKPETYGIVHENSQKGFPYWGCVSRIRMTNLAVLYF